MSVTNLEHGEKDLDLETRDPRGAKKVADDLQRVKTGKPTVEDELKAIRERIAAAREVKPNERDRHCLDCFEKGRNAAVRVIEGK